MNGAAVVVHVISAWDLRRDYQRPQPIVVISGPTIRAGDNLIALIARPVILLKVLPHDAYLGVGVVPTPGVRLR
jgi:hypothetical protein